MVWTKILDRNDHQQDKVDNLRDNLAQRTLSSFHVNFSGFHAEKNFSPEPLKTLMSP